MFEFRIPIQISYDRDGIIPIVLCSDKRNFLGEIATPILRIGRILADILDIFFYIFMVVSSWIEVVTSGSVR